MNEDRAKQLSFLYFEGKISKEDENALFTYISLSDINKDIFRNWEKEWYQTNVSHLAVETEWKNLQTRIKTRKVINPTVKLTRRTALRRISAVAAVLIIAIVGSYIGLTRMIENKYAPNVFTLEAPDGGRSKVILSDGSIVWLNAGSKLQYSNDFNKSNREVMLNGEGYFEIVNQGGKPFVVKTREYSIIVKGTKFNITSYPNDNYITTSLMEGAIELQYKEKTLNMKPGETAQLDVRSHKLSNKKNQTDQYRSWINGDMKYDSITLEELLNRLSRQYNVNINLESTRNKDRHLSVSLQNKEMLEEILMGISKIFSVKVEYRGKDIYILDNA